ncbi:MAG: class I lanthipeptide [Bacteroidales bacterium]|jgi:hypothetical protein|nr:class I lanthipeptide [Bacteroidales bacterium]
MKKKLQLSKDTIADLTEKGMSEIKGGTGGAGTFSCYTGCKCFTDTCEEIKPDKPSEAGNCYSVVHTHCNNCNEKVTCQP